MPTYHKCSFCGKQFLHGHGILFVKNDGTTYWFCSRRCRVYMLEHKKDPRKVKWTEYYGREVRGQ